MLDAAGKSYEAFGLMAPPVSAPTTPTSVDQRIADLTQGLHTLQQAFHQAVHGSVAPAPGP